MISQSRVISTAPRHSQYTHSCYLRVLPLAYIHSIYCNVGNHASEKSQQQVVHENLNDTRAQIVKPNMTLKTPFPKLRPVQLIHNVTLKHQSAESITSAVISATIVRVCLYWTLAQKTNGCLGFFCLLVRQSAGFHCSVAQNISKVFCVIFDKNNSECSNGQISTKWWYVNKAGFSPLNIWHETSMASSTVDAAVACNQMRKTASRKRVNFFWEIFQNFHASVNRFLVCKFKKLLSVMEIIHCAHH